MPKTPTKALPNVLGGGGGCVLSFLLLCCCWGGFRLQKNGDNTTRVIKLSLEMPKTPPNALSYVCVWAVKGSVAWPWDAGTSWKWIKPSRRTQCRWRAAERWAAGHFSRCDNIHESGGEDAGSKLSVNLPSSPSFPPAAPPRPALSSASRFLSLYGMVVQGDTREFQRL